MGYYNFVYREDIFIENKMCSQRYKKIAILKKGDALGQYIFFLLNKVTWSKYVRHM